jgi:hypothetical protein
MVVFSKPVAVASAVVRGDSWSRLIMSGSA